jgi:hypothetical protein
VPVSLLFWVCTCLTPCKQKRRSAKSTIYVKETDGGIMIKSWVDEMNRNLLTLKHLILSSFESTNAYDQNGTHSEVNIKEE